MNVLVTGAAGFVGRNLISQLACDTNLQIFEYDVDTPPHLLGQYVRECEFVYHLAGVNRPKNNDDYSDNVTLTSRLLSLLKQHQNACPILITSSIQATLDNPYGQSKRAGEDLIFAHCAEMGAPDFVYRLPNLFGKWSRPNYNSVISTFCHNIARDLPIRIDNPDTLLTVAHISDVVSEFRSALTVGEGSVDQPRYRSVNPVYQVTLGQIAAMLHEFHDTRGNLAIPDLADGFTRKLYSTYLTYLPEDSFSYPLTTHQDNRGAFTEFIHTPDRGQVSVNVINPGYIKGNHWHQTKNEKFLVVRGSGVIRFRQVNGNDVLKYAVDGSRLEVVDIPPGYTHNIENTGRSDMVVVMWADERYDPQNPDTYFLEVSAFE